MIAEAPVGDLLLLTQSNAVPALTCKRWLLRLSRSNWRANGHGNWRPIALHWRPNTGKAADRKVVTLRKTPYYSHSLNPDSN